MRIGISSKLDIGIFKDYFESVEHKNILERLRQNSASPAVNTLCLSLLKEGHFLRIFTIAKEEHIIKSDRIEIFLIKGENRYPITYLWGIFNDSKKIKTVIENNHKDLNVIHSHWTYEYTHSLRHLSNSFPVLCTVRDWAPLIFMNMKFKDKITWCFKNIMAYQVFKCPSIHFIANSPYTSSLLQKGYGINAPVIPNSIKESFISLSTHKPSTKLKIICISSSHDKRKNVTSLVKAFGLIKSKYQDAELYIIGNAFYKGSPVEREWRSKNIMYDGIRMIGGIEHDQLKSYLDEGTIYITPSREETFGNTILEAISRGLPVIGGIKSGAVPYVLHNGEAGFLCDVENINNIVNTIEYVYTHEEEAAKRTKRGLEIIQNEYSQNIVCEKYRENYALLSKKKTE